MGDTTNKAGDFGALYTQMDNQTLLEHIRAALEEQRRRAADAGDFEAICETGFTQGFDTKGHARTPIVTNGLLVCYGSVVEKSSMSHDCTFAHIEENWVWEHPETLHDDVRKRPERGREHQRSVSILAATEGMEFDLITSKMRNGVHQMQSVRSYRIENGKIELVKTRNIKTERYH